MLYTVRQQKIDNVKDKITVKLVKKEKKIKCASKTMLYVTENI